MVIQMRQAPFRPALEAISHTLVYEAMIVGDLTLPTELIASIETPTLVIDGEQSSQLLRNAARAVAEALPNGRRHTLPGQTHDISPEATAPVLTEFSPPRHGEWRRRKCDASAQKSWLWLAVAFESEGDSLGHCYVISVGS
jgi:pimeloyl-ACP methyl ester carboxylesterase